jgi:hypothetical protein
MCVSVDEWVGVSEETSYTYTHAPTVSSFCFRIHLFRVKAIQMNVVGNQYIAVTQTIIKE